MTTTLIVAAPTPPRTIAVETAARFLTEASSRKLAAYRMAPNVKTRLGEKKSEKTPNGITRRMLDRELRPMTKPISPLEKP
jgi:hypothetical protein